MMFLGFLAGVVIYCATAFPVSLVTGWEGETWGVVCMLWGVVCGAGGTLAGVASE